MTFVEMHGPTSPGGCRPSGWSPALGQGSHFLASVEAARFLAAFGVVWFHCDSGPWRRVGYAGLPIFIMVSLALLAKKDPVDGFAQFVKRRAARLLSPWVFWTLVYLAYQLARGSILHREPRVNDVWRVGSSLHLWYLPYVFVASLAVWGLRYSTRHVPRTFMVLVLVLAAMLSIFVVSRILEQCDLWVPVPQWLFGSPGVLLGMGIGLVLGLESSCADRRWLAAIALVAAFFCLVLAITGHTGLAVSYGIAIPLVCGIFRWRDWESMWATRLGALSFGIYLVHPLVSGVLSYLTGSQMRGFGIRPIAVFLGSVALTLLLKRSPLRVFV